METPEWQKWQIPQSGERHRVPLSREGVFGLRNTFPGDNTYQARYRLDEKYVSRGNGDVCEKEIALHAM